MFSINYSPYTKGFQMTFENGWTVSVQFGKVNYAGNHKNEDKNPVAEIAAWDKNDNWYQFENDKVEGWVTPDQVADFIAMIKAK